MKAVIVDSNIISIHSLVTNVTEPIVKNLQGQPRLLSAQSLAKTNLNELCQLRVFLNYIFIKFLMFMYRHTYIIYIL